MHARPPALAAAAGCGMPLPIVFTLAMAVDAGWRPCDIDRQVRARRWTPLRRGVYALTAQLPVDGPRRLARDVAAVQLAIEHDVVGTHARATARPAVDTTTRPSGLSDARSRP